MWGKKSLFNHEKVSKNNGQDCLENVLLLFIFLLSVLIVKDSHILDQTWKAFNTKLGPHWKDQENSYQVRQALTLSCKLVAPILV